MKEKTKKVAKKAKNEIKSILLVTLYFAVWFGILIGIKKLILIDYNIEFVGLSTALIGALIMAKVVLIMEYIEFGQWVKKQPPFVDVILRTFLYTSGVLFVLLLEKAFESRHESDGFTTALKQVFQHRDIYKVWASTLVISISLFWYNVFAILTQYFNNHELSSLFLNIPLEKVLLKNAEHKDE
ncbi:hypothetical protein [Flavobacterium sp. N3904]|uniref:hypothetical protein n=1 Tax=Flavobacterium sp. N3904 TaxID=2986835 RepID=UPI0022242004|nr:hypothetical protein [Flavobacterium sp. N3904]